MKISTKTQYGLRALIYLARSKKRILPLKEIAKNEGIPFDYLEKIISKLEKGGIVQSKRGKNGGYFLASSAKKIKIKDVINVLEGDLLPIKCLSKETLRCPKEKNCLAKNFWEIFKRSIENTLDKITLEELINK